MSAPCQFSFCVNHLYAYRKPLNFSCLIFTERMKLMCQYQTLYHDDSTGYVVRCQECEKIQLGYGNVMITFSRSDFEDFRWWLRKIREDQSPAQSPTLR